jgi:hypothetical protein
VCLGGVNVQDVSSPKSIEAKKLARHNQLSGFGRISLAAREALHKLRGEAARRAWV